MALIVGRWLLNSNVNFSSHAHASEVFSRTLSLTSPPVEICDERMLTVKVRVVNLPVAVPTSSNIKRRSSALTVVLVSAC